MTPAYLKRAVRRAIEAAETDDKDLAARLGCSREYISRERSKMRAERGALADAAGRRRAR